MPEEWRTHFRNAAEKNRWHYTTLARQARLNESTMASWAQPAGGKGRPDIADAIAIAEVMQMSLDEIFRGIIPDTRVEQVISRAVHEVEAILRDELKQKSADTD